MTKKLAITQKGIKSIIKDIEKQLLERIKNNENADIQPLGVFSKVNATAQIKVRIDDILGSILRGRDVTFDTRIEELIGCLILLIHSMDYDEDIDEVSVGEDK